MPAAAGSSSRSSTTVRRSRRPRPGSTRWAVRSGRTFAAGGRRSTSTKSSSIRPPEPLAGRIVSVEPLGEQHREGLRAAAEAGPEIFRFLAWPGDFDDWFDEALASDDVAFAVCVGGEPAGSTRYLNYAPEHRRVEIGWTWLRRSAWGTGANVEAKLLLLEHAFERCGLQRVEFKTD